MGRIYVLHENPAWLPPLAEAFAQRGLSWLEWFLDRFTFDLSEPPPEGIFYNRMSASSHTREHRYSAELTAAVLAWLTRHERRVVNGPGALDLEISKVRQYAALERAGVPTPRTVVVAGRDGLAMAAKRHFPGQPLILKPNRGGKGLGVRLFATAEALAAHVDSPDYEAPVDGLNLLQEYVRAARPCITRAEFVGGRFLYAVEADTSVGFELCPADVCAVEIPAGPMFQIVDGIDRALQELLEHFLRVQGIEVAAVELITGTDGRTLAYDVNTNTNYNAEAEQRDGREGTDQSGPGALARFLGDELSRLSRSAA
jgi:hypothetical protein